MRLECVEVLQHGNAAFLMGPFLFLFLTLLFRQFFFLELSSSTSWSLLLHQLTRSSIIFLMLGFLVWHQLTFFWRLLGSSFKSWYSSFLLYVICFTQFQVFHHATLVTNIDKNLRHIQDLAFVFEMSVILHILLITIDRYTNTVVDFD